MATIQYDYQLLFTEEEIKNKNINFTEEFNKRYNKRFGKLVKAKCRVCGIMKKLQGLIPLQF